MTPRHGLSIMENLVSNAVEKMADFESMIVLFQDVRKMVPPITGFSPALLPDRIFVFALSFFYISFCKRLGKMLKKKCRSILILERITELEITELVQ